MGYQVTVVLPVYNEADGISLLLEQIENSLHSSIRFILVNDGSSDRTGEVLRSYKTQASNSIRIVELARNFGHQKAIMAGLSSIDHDPGTIIVVMDSDFQDNPTDISSLIQKLEEGFDCVYAIRPPESGSLIVNLLTNIFYLVQERLVVFKIPRHAGAFSAFKFKMLKEILRFSEIEPYFPGIRAYVGFKQAGVKVKRDARKFGTSRVGFFGLINLSLNGLLGFSSGIMRAVLYAGLIVTSICFLLGIIIITLRITGVIDVLGFTTIAVFILGLFGIQMTITGFIGEYLGKLFIESKKRPNWIVKEVVDA